MTSLLAPQLLFLCIVSSRHQVRVGVDDIRLLLSGDVVDELGGCNRTREHIFRPVTWIGSIIPYYSLIVALLLLHLIKVLDGSLLLRAPTALRNILENLELTVKELVELQDGRNISWSTSKGRR